MDISNYISVPEKIVKKKDRSCEREKYWRFHPSFRAFCNGLLQEQENIFFIENVYGICYVNKLLNRLGLLSPFISCVFLCNDLSIRFLIGEAVCQSVIPALK